MGSVGRQAGWANKQSIYPDVYGKLLLDCQELFVSNLDANDDIYLGSHNTSRSVFSSCLSLDLLL